MAGPGIDLGSVWASVGVRLDNLFRGVSQAQATMRSLDRALTSQAQTTSSQLAAAFAGMGRGMAEQTRAASARVVREFAGMGRGLEAQAQQTSRRVVSAFDGMGRALDRILTTVFSGYVIRRFAQAIDDLAATAFQAQAGLNIFARQVARMGEDLDASLRLIAGLAAELRVPQEILARSAAELLRYGYSVQQIVDIFRGAVASGLLVGRTTVDAINTVTEALVSQRSVLLNVIGITENLDPAFARYARSLGKTAEELTNAERATAAWRMITQATAAEVADLELLLEGYGGAVADAGTQSYNLRRVLGDALLPAVTAVRQAWADMLSTLARLGQTTGVRSAIQSIGDAFASIINALRDALNWLAAHRDLIRELAERVIPALVAVISVRLIPQLIQLAAQLFTVAGRWGLVAGAAILAMEALNLLNRAAGQDLFDKLLASMAANARQLVANLQYLWEWLTSGGRVSDATRRMWEEVTRQGNEAAKVFQDALIKSVEVLSDPGQAWERIKAAFSQRMAEIRALFEGAPLPALQSVQPTVTGAPPLSGFGDEQQAVDRFADAARRYQSAIALARVGQGDLNRALSDYVLWLTRVVRGEDEAIQAAEDRAKAANELAKAFAELTELDPSAIARLGPQIGEAILGALLGGLPAAREAYEGLLSDIAQLTGETFAQERLEVQRQVEEYSRLFELVYGRGTQEAERALGLLRAWSAMQMDDIARREREFYERRNDEIVRAALRTIERQAELWDWSAARQADAIQGLIDRMQMSAELAEELAHRVAMLRKQAAAEDAMAGAQAALALIRQTTASLDEQRVRLEELLATYEAMGEVGREAAELIREELERVNAAIVEQATTLLDVLRTLRDTRGEAIVEATEEIRAAYDEIARLRMTDRQRFEADLADRVAAMRAAGVDAITIEQWVAAQRALYRERELQEIVRREREAAQEARRAWADALLGPFADPLARLVQGVRAFRVGERLAEAFGSLRQLFADALPDALQTGLARVLSWLRDQASRVGDWLSGALGSLGGMLGGAGQAAAGAVGSVLGALGSAAGAAAGAIGALVGAVGEFLVALLEASPQFRQFSRILEQIFNDVARTVGALIEPFIPVVQSLREVLAPILEAVRPLLRQVGEVFAAFARLALQLLAPILQLLQPILRGMLWLLDNIVVPVLNVLGATLVAVYNAIAKAVNLIIDAINFLYPFGDLIKWRMKEATWTPIQRSDEVDTGAGGGGEDAAGYQIAQITGPTRDFFAELFRPISNLSILPGLFDNLTRAVYAVRDLLAASLGTSLAGAADALTSAATALTDAAVRLVTAVETLAASLRSEGGALVIELVQSMEIARVASVTIARVDVIQVAQAGTVQVVGGRVRSPWDWVLGLRGVGA